MQYASDGEGNRIEATPGGRAVCPSCDSQVIAKCGDIKIWHWAHLASDCDPWHEDMTQWHIDWQSEFDEQYREVVIRKDGSTHRADVALSSGRVIEFQHSPISVDEIAEREKFYGFSMVWVFDITEICENKDRFTVRDKKTHHTFSWKWARQSIARTQRTTFLDMGGGVLFRIAKMYGRNGWGHLIDIDNFLKFCHSNTAQKVAA